MKTLIDFLLFRIKITAVWSLKWHGLKNSAVVRYRGHWKDKYGNFRIEVLPHVNITFLFFFVMIYFGEEEYWADRWKKENGYDKYGIREKE